MARNGILAVGEANQQSKKISGLLVSFIQPGMAMALNYPNHLLVFILVYILLQTLQSIMIHAISHSTSGAKVEVLQDHTTNE